MSKYVAISFLFIMYFSASAQHLRPRDIPQIRLSDFQAQVKSDAPYPVYMNVRIFYRLDSVYITPGNAYKLKVITMVVPYAPGSFFDVKQIDQKQVPQLLKYQTIAFINNQRRWNLKLNDLLEATYIGKQYQSIIKLIRLTT